MRYFLFVTIFFAANASAFQLSLQQAPTAPKILQVNDDAQTEFRVELRADQAFTLWGFHTVIQTIDGMKMVYNQVLPHTVEIEANTAFTSENLVFTNLPGNLSNIYQVTVLPLGWIGTQGQAEGPITLSISFKTE